MIMKLSKLKYWELAALGVCSAATAIMLVAGGIGLLVNLFPQAYQAGQIAYLISAAALAWIITGIFIEAGFTRYRSSHLDESLDRLAEALGLAITEAEKKNEAGRG
jgi:hypothetical protein